MKEVKLVLNKSNAYLSEIFQSIDIKFCFVNKKYEEVSAPVKCRDFLGDCLYSKRNKEPVSIYGFVYNYEENPYDDCRLSLKFPDVSSRQNFITNITWLHKKEKKAGVQKSVLYTTQNKDTLIIEGSNCWIQSIWKFSLYTFYLKVISYPSISQVLHPERDYIIKFTKTKENAMLSKIKSKEKEKCYTELHKAHNNMGFYSVLNGNLNTEKVLGDK